MMKKPVLAVFVLVLVAGGFFYWRQTQADVRALNKTLPAGVKVTKSIIGNEYSVVNKIDGYSFKIPPEWQGIKEIEYIKEREESGYLGTSLNLNGQESSGRIISVDRFKSGEDMNIDLESWAKKEFETFGLVGDFIKDNVVNIKVVKTQENIHFGGEYVYFLKKDSFIYSITGPSEDFIRYIITNGKW